MSSNGLLTSINARRRGNLTSSFLNDEAHEMKRCAVTNVSVLAVHLDVRLAAGSNGEFLVTMSVRWPKMQAESSLG